ncbi:hypothetical protein [Streptomyces rubiginosohelvolus]|uniref:hypothetical protein n=1 Tax=Streptomyces rubiginosohelvolus TaxID=67362 RepID=UPI0033B19D47
MLFYASTGGNIGYRDGGLIGISPTLTGWQSVNYASVSMVAPAGATKVRVVLTVTGLAAGEQVCFDDVYLTTIDDRHGELLDYATRSAEEGSSEWTAINGTLARAGGWLYAGAGFYCLGATSTSASAPMYLRTVSLHPVTPGKTYVTYAATQGPGLNLTGAAGIEWFTADNVWIATTTAPATYNQALTRVACSGVAPANAAKARPIYRADPTAVGQSVYLDDVSFLAPKTGAEGKAPNQLTYEEWSTESTLPAWTVAGATTSRSYFTSGITEGFYALKLTPDTPGSGVLSARLDRLVPVIPGTTYQVGATIYRHNTDTAQVVTSAVRTVIDWYDSAGNVFQVDDPDQFYPAESASEWYAQINSETRTCPEGAAYARVGFEVDSTSPLVDYWVADTIYLSEAVSEYDLIADNATGCVTLTVNYVPANGANNAVLTIKRIDQDGKAFPMRAYGRTWDLAPNPYSPLVIEDYEAPLGTRVWYSVAWSNASGGTFGARILTRTINAPFLADPDYVWFKSPGVPALNTTVMMEAPPTWARAARSTRYDVVGRKNPIHITGIRSGRTSSITVLVWEPEANELFNSLLDTGTPALVQAMPGFGIDGNLYVAIGDVEVEPLSQDAREDGWRWTLAITEVDRPDGGLQGSAASTWQEILDHVAYPTWEHVFNAHETWTDVLTKG